MLLLFFLFAAVEAQSCDYSLNDWYLGEGICINPKETASATFSWPPLFPGDVKFVYAADDIDGMEVAALEPLLDEGKVRSWKSSLVGWWLEYDKVSMNNTDLEMVTDMKVFFTSAGESIGANGCDDLLGKTCTDDLKSTLMNLWSDLPSYEHPLANLATASGLESCPPDMFGDYDSLDPRINTLNEVTTFNTMCKSPMRGIALADSPVLAKEEVSNETVFKYIYDDEILPSGNASFTYSRALYEQRDFRDQSRKAAVAILMRYPLPDSDANQVIRNSTTRDISVAMVCAELSGSGEAEDDNDDGEDHAIANGVPVALLAAAIGFVIFFQ